MQSLCWFNRSCVLVILFVIHVVVGVHPGMWYVLELDGVRVATAESSASGIVQFEFEMPPDFGEGPHYANVSGLPLIDIETGECKIEPREPEGDD